MFGVQNLIVAAVVLLCLQVSAAGMSGSQLLTASAANVATALGAGIVMTGMEHGVFARRFLGMLPPWLPCRLSLIYISGLIRVACGIGLMVPQVRMAAQVVLLVFLLLILPINLRWALLASWRAPRAVSGWVRLVLQAAWISWAVWCCVLA